jgi:anti-sigma factor RsiW
MSDLLNSLTDEALLLMYAADELPSSDRAEVDRRLIASSELRAQLDQLRHLNGAVMSAIDSLDRADGITTDLASSRRVAREIRRHQTELAVRPAQSAPNPRRNLAWLTYPAAAAAAIAFVLLGLWGVGAFDSMIKVVVPPDQITRVQPRVDPDQHRDTILAELIGSFDSTRSAGDEESLRMRFSSDEDDRGLFF